MSTRATIAHGPGWALYEEMTDETVYVDVHGTRYCAFNGGAWIELPPAVIDAIRAAKPESFPHLREAK
jgi:hypothetical protein